MADKKKRIDDEDLDRIAGAGIDQPPATHLDDDTPVQDSGIDSPMLDRKTGGTGGSGPGPDNQGTDGGGLQDLG